MGDELWRAHGPNVFVNPVTRAISVYAGIPFFGLCLLYSLWRLISPSPVFVIDEEGILDNASAIAAGRVRWDEILGVETGDFSGQPFLSVITRDPDAIVARQSFYKRWLMRVNMGMGFPPVVVPQAILPMSVEDLRAMMTSYGRIES